MFSFLHFLRAIAGLEAATSAEQLLLGALVTVLTLPLTHTVTTSCRDLHEDLGDHGWTEYRWPTVAAVAMAATIGTVVALLPPLLYLVPAAMGIRKAASCVIERRRRRRVRDRSE